MLTPEDIPIINEALAKGADVRIQNTPDGGFRILSDTVKVLKRTPAKPRNKTTSNNSHGVRSNPPKPVKPD